MSVSSWYPVRSGLAMVAAALGLMVVAPAAQAQSWDEVVAAAKQEGKVVLYSNLQPNGIEPLMGEFRAEFPEIQTEQIRLGSNPLIERFQTEFNAGRNLADVVITVVDERVYKGMKEGWMAEWTPPELSNFAADVSEGNKLFTLQQIREAIIWNKSLVQDADAPKEWVDLFDPKWKGKVGMNPPWRSLVVQQVLALWEEMGITDAARKMQENDVRFFEGGGGIIQAVLRGDVQVAHLTDLPLNPLLADGAPIGFVYPESGTSMSFGKGFVAANAPHPNAARVFFNWLMSEKGQLALQAHGGVSATRNGIAPLSHVPATADLSNVVNGEKLLTPERQSRIVNEWRTAFGIR